MNSSYQTHIIVIAGMRNCIANIANDLIWQQTPQFESFAQELKIYIEKHSYMNVKWLHFWIENVRSNYKIIQEEGQSHPIIKLTQDWMEILVQIGFDFESTHYDYLVVLDKKNTRNYPWQKM